MLVSGLKDLSLYHIISSKNINCSDLHDALCQCVREMVAKYRHKQGSGTKLTVKTRATENLLVALCKVPKGDPATCEMISSALELHAKALQGYEHLLSKKGNTYALIEQTQSLMKDDDHAPASLLRYHDLRNKLLGPDTPVDDETGKIISELDGKKVLTLENLEILEEVFRIHAGLQTSLARGNKLVVFESSLHHEVIEQPEKTLLPGILGKLGAPANIPASIRIDIRKAMKKAGYRYTEEGMCYGIAWAALLACVRQGGQAYMERMQYLKYLEQANTPPWRGAMDIHQHQVYPFFDVVTLGQTNYTKMTGYSKGIGFPGRQKVGFPGSIIRSHLPDYQVVPVMKHVFIVECTPAMFIQFLQQTREKNKDIPFGVMIHYPVHTTSIGFDGKKWLAANHDCHYYTEDTNPLQTFFCGQSNGKIIASIEVVTGNEDSLDINADALVVNAKKSMFTLQVLFAALEYDYANITTDCIKVIGQHGFSPEILLEWLTCKNPRNIPGFSVALCRGYSNTITAFIQGSTKVIATISMPEERKAKLLCELFVSVNTSGMPGFFRTLRNGYTDAIRAFIKGVSEAVVTFGLPDEQKAQLLYDLLVSINDVDGTPGFHMTLKLGFAEAIVAFIQESTSAFDKLSLTRIEKVKWLYKLLLACKKDGTPGFYMTLEHAVYLDAITAFIRESAAAFAKLSPSESEIEIETAKWLCKLFASKKANEPGFFRVFLDNNPEATTVFIQAITAAIATLRLPKEQKIKLLYELLAGKRKTIPGFYMSLFHGRSNTITAFIQASAVAVATFCDSEEEKTELLYKLFHRLENEQKLTFLLGIKNGGPAVQKAFNEGINQLPLSDKQKETLKYKT